MNGPLTVKELRVILAKMPPDTLVCYWGARHWCYFATGYYQLAKMQERDDGDAILYPASSKQGKGKIVNALLLNVGRPEPGQEDYIP